MDISTKNIDDLIGVLESFIRDLKINQFTGDNNIGLIPIRRKFFSRSQKMLDQLCDLGGIITGSFALKHYTIFDQPLLDRKINDFDVIISRDSFLKFCKEKNFKRSTYDKDRLVMNINTGLYIGSYGYTSKTPSYLFGKTFDIIVKDDTSQFNQVGKYRIATIENILSEKLKLFKYDLQYCRLYVFSRSISSKHLDDIIESMVKIFSSQDPLSIYKLMFKLDIVNIENLNHLIKVIKNYKNDKV